MSLMVDLHRSACLFSPSAHPLAGCHFTIEFQRFFAYAVASLVRNGDAWTPLRRVMPASLVRLSISALIATISVLPDMANAAISGLSKTGYKMPAANGKAMTL